MGSLSNLYISQSYQSLIHLGNDTSASATQIELQDGVGQGLGIYVNTNGDVSIDGALIVSGTFDIEGRIIVNDDVRINGNLAVSGATSLTGSLAVTQNITASNISVQSDLNVGGTLFANKVVTLIESSSIIYSSGSNILGDEVSDTQTLIGSVIMSGSAALTGSMGISANLDVKGNISSSTISGIGNVTTYSQSVDARLDYLEGPFSTSVDVRLDNLENFTASTFVNFSQSVDARLDIVEATASLYVPFSASVDFRLDELENWSSSLQTNFATTAELTTTRSLIENELYLTASALQANIDQKLFTSSFNAYTQSTNTTINNLSSSINGTINALSTSIAITDNAQTARIDGLSSFTGSYATTGSNVFIGNQTITGSSIFSGSVNGGVFPITIAANTASMNCALGNFFTVTLGAGSTRFEATNIASGQTISLKILNSTSGSQFTGSASVKFPNGFAYIPTSVSSSTDIITFLSFDNSAIYAVAANYFV